MSFGGNRDGGARGGDREGGRGGDREGGRGGRETLEVLRAQDPRVRAILMTGYSTEAVFRDYASHGFQAALAKPFPLEALRSVLAEVLASTGPRA